MAVPAMRAARRSPTRLYHVNLISFPPRPSVPSAVKYLLLQSHFPPVIILPMDLLKKIANTRACVGVIGLGYVGLPLLRAFHEAGFPVIGFDIDPEKITPT